MVEEHKGEMSSVRRDVMDTINKGLVTVCTIVFLVLLLYTWGKLSQLEMVYNSIQWQQTVITSIQQLNQRIINLENKKQTVNSDQDVVEK
jgi:hypothetical protein